MMLIITTLLFVSVASAFTPFQSSSSLLSSTTPTSTSLKLSEIDLGATPPLGEFDPFNLIEKEPEKFIRRRAVERKHGRIAMVAVVGTLVHNSHIVFDGYISPSNGIKFSDIPTGFDGLFAIPIAGLVQILAFIGFIELAWLPASQYDGDYGVGWFGSKILDPEERERKLNVELNNGRLAMLGILGNMVGEGVTGQTMYEQYMSGNFWPFEQKIYDL